MPSGNFPTYPDCDEVVPLDLETIFEPAPHRPVHPLAIVSRSWLVDLLNFLTEQ